MEIPTPTRALLERSMDQRRSQPALQEARMTVLAAPRPPQLHTSSRFPWKTLGQLVAALFSLVTLTLISVPLAVGFSLAVLMGTLGMVVGILLAPPMAVLLLAVALAVRVARLCAKRAGKG